VRSTRSGHETGVITRKTGPVAWQPPGRHWPGRISQASLKRRKLTAALLERLGTCASEDEQLAIRSLQQAEQEMQHRSQAHVGLWTVDRIGSDWPGYCRASRVLRGCMETDIATAERILYPMLERADQQRPRP